MRYIILLLMLCGAAFTASAQNDTLISQEPALPDAPEVRDTTLLKSAEVMPEFPGGQLAMIDFLQGHIRYPQMEKESGIMGTVYVSYVVETDGRITNIRPFKEVEDGPGLTKEAIRIVSMFPNHTPGMNGGRPVRVQMIMPIKFVLN